MKKIVVTGGGGSMGTVITDGLRATGKYEVISTARRPKQERNDVALDVCDLQTCIEVFKGVDTVIHMAFLLWAKDVEDVIKNVRGIYNVYEAARINSVKRVIFGSSNHVYGFYPIDANVGDYDEYRPDTLYGVSKCYAEIMGRYYSDKHGVSSFNVRVGHCRGIREDGFQPGIREYNQWLSNRDLVHLMQCCIEADPSIKYKCIAGVSNNSSGCWDISKLKEEIGYMPQDDGSALVGPDTINNLTPFKGGEFPFMED